MLTSIERGQRLWVIAIANDDLHSYRRDKKGEWSEGGEQVDTETAFVLEAWHEENVGDTDEDVSEEELEEIVDEEEEREESKTEESEGEGEEETKPRRSRGRSTADK